MKILGAIIAGGRSTRMGGREKSLLVLDNVTLIERVLSRLRFQCDDVIINANGEQSRFGHFGSAIIADSLPDPSSPLWGLHAALDYGNMLGFDAVATTPVDAPFLPLDLVQRLTEAGEVTGAAIARSGAQNHHLTGLWTTALAKPLENLILDQGFKRVQDFATKAKAEIVQWSDMPHDPFFNINTPEDLNLATRIAKGEA